MFSNQPESGKDEFYSLARVHYQELKGFFYKRGLFENGEDLVQDTFTRALKNLGNFRQESSVRTWLYSIAHSVYKNHLRSIQTQKNQKSQSLEEKEMEPELLQHFKDPNLTPDKALVLSEAQIQLRKALSELPSQMLHCMIFRYYHGLSYREIAQVMNLSINTVKSHLFQGREKIKIPLKPYYHDLDT